MIEQEFKAFREAALPLMQWLADNRHPHVTVIVDSERAELLEGQANARRVSKEHELEKLEKALAETAHTAIAQARQTFAQARQIKERDEARAEVERLKEALKNALAEIGTLQNLAPVIPPTITRPEPSRLEIAAMAMQGFIANGTWGLTIADRSVDYADALIAAAKG